ncbi:MAG: hypothetical protein R6W81_02580 [Bacteroidales bacterium]
MSLVKDPIPSPFVVLDDAIVGFIETDQQTPRSVTKDPPSLVMVPPDVADVGVIAVITSVVTAGTDGPFLQEVKHVTAAKKAKTAINDNLTG